MRLDYHDSTVTLHCELLACELLWQLAIHSFTNHSIDNEHHFHEWSIGTMKVIHKIDLGNIGSGSNLSPTNKGESPHCVLVSEKVE